MIDDCFCIELVRHVGRNSVSENQRFLLIIILLHGIVAVLLCLCHCYNYVSRVIFVQTSYSTAQDSDVELRIIFHFKFRMTLYNTKIRTMRK